MKCNAKVIDVPFSKAATVFESNDTSASKTLIDSVFRFLLSFILRFLLSSIDYGQLTGAMVTKGFVLFCNKSTMDTKTVFFVVNQNPLLHKHNRFTFLSTTSASAIWKIMNNNSPYNDKQWKKQWSTIVHTMMKNNGQQSTLQYTGLLHRLLQFKFAASNLNNNIRNKKHSNEMQCNPMQYSEM